MILPLSFFVNLGCPHCGQVQPYSQLFRTNDLYLSGSITGVFGALGRPLAFWECRKCAKKLRLGDYSKLQRLLLFVPSFFILFIAGTSALDHVSFFASVDPAYSGYVKFVIAGVLSVLISIWVSARSLEVEIIE